MGFDLPVWGFSVDKPRGCQFHSPLPPYFPPTTASFNPEATFLNYSSGREKIKIKEFWEGSWRQFKRLCWEKQPGSRGEWVRTAQCLQCHLPLQLLLGSWVPKHKQSFCSYSPPTAKGCKAKGCRGEAEIFTHHPLKCHKNPLSQKRYQYINIWKL